MAVVVYMGVSPDTYSAMLKDRDYDVTPHIILILSLTLTQNARGVGEGVGGVVWILSASWACVVDGWKVVTPVED